MTNVPSQKGTIQAQSSMVVLQAVKFTDKKVPGLCLDLDEDLQAAGCFTEAPWPSNGSSGTRCHPRPSFSVQRLHGFRQVV